jgi:hypothetical protein
MSFKETTILQCPSKKSFDSHFDNFDALNEICVSNGCSFKWKILDKKKRTYVLNVNGASKEHQQNALIGIMQFLFAKGIEPAMVISTKTEPDPPIQKALEILEA